MIDVATFKLENIAGEKNDEWDEDGDLTLCKKMVVDQEFKRILIKPQ